MLENLLQSQNNDVPLRVMTYNIHACRGTDGKWSPERIADVIAQARPDIVALQEVDVGRVRSGGVDQAILIAEQLGMTLQFSPALHLMEEKYGDAILTPWPSRLIRTGRLPGLRMFPNLEPRGALWVQISVRGVDIQMMTTHLGLLRRERMRQVEQLIGPDWLGSPRCDGPVVLGGDFNFLSRSRAYRKLTGVLNDVQFAPGAGAPHATFPSRYPRFRIDYIFASPDVRVNDVQSVRTPLTRIASDHLPVVANLAVEARRSAEQSAGEFEIAPNV